MAVDTIDDFFDTSPGLLFIAAADGRLHRCSRALRERLGERLGDDATMASIVADQDRPAVAALLEALAETDEPASCTVRLVDDGDDQGELHYLARRSAAGTIHGQLEALPGIPKHDETVEHVLFHAIMNTLDIVLWAIDRSGKFVFHDGKALATAGLERGQFLGMNLFEIYPPELVGPIHQALAGTPSHYTSEAHGVHWETWNVPLRDANGVVTHTAGLTLDVSSRVENERELERQLETIKSQQRAIHELSAPLINVWDKVVTVPLIGGLDSERTDELTERLLAELHRANTRFAILDLTGVEAVDTSIAGHILRLLASMRLLGVEGMVTGVSPQVAQTMVGVGIDFESVLTHRSLREGLRYCMRALIQDR